MGIKLYFGLILILIFIPANHVFATNNWNEDFEVNSILNLTDWVFQGYNNNNVNGSWIHVNPIPHEFTIKDGGLSTKQQTGEFYALHPSTQLVGTWSYDWFVPPNESGHAFIFLSN
ncbi:MAG: hypothetical protein ACW967_06200, partial [Candidatus Hodarchaeales archaeon]